MFNLGLCEKKNASFFSFVFCFLRKKKNKTKHRFHGRFSSFHGSKNAPISTDVTSLFCFPPPFLFILPKANQKKKCAPRLSPSHLCPSRLVQHAATEIPHAQRRLQRTAEIVMLQSRQLHRSQNTRHVLLTERVAQLAGT